ncbi:hypothetical protein J6590_077320 [Homalodisca vitripennis]|nr:hypothetical protein J6590_077320 [Homalodisca vitripennis]
MYFAAKYSVTKRKGDRGAVARPIFRGKPKVSTVNQPGPDSETEEPVHLTRSPEHQPSSPCIEGVPPWCTSQPTTPSLAEDDDHHVTLSPGANYVES